MCPHWHREKQCCLLWEDYIDRNKLCFAYGCHHWLLRGCIPYLLALIIMLLGLNSCYYSSEPYSPPPEPWLCSINADGTGFRKIKKVDLNFGTNGFWDIYMTKDNKIIFYGDKLWISDTDGIELIQIVPDSLIMDNHPRISESFRENKLFFAANGSIYQLTIPMFELTKIASTVGGKMMNPVLSVDDKALAFVTHRQILGDRDYAMTVSYLSLGNEAVYNLPSLGQYCHNVAFRSADNRLYYNDLYELKSSNKSGDNIQVIGSYPSNTSSLFGLTYSEHYMLVQGQKLRIIDLFNNAVEEISCLAKDNLDFICSIVKTEDFLYYIDLNKKLMKYDMNAKTSMAIPIDYSKVVFGNNTLITSTWDGSTIYMICSIGAGEKNSKWGL